MSSASTPSPARIPEPERPLPAIVRPQPRKPRRAGLWAAGVVILIAAGLWLWRAQTAAREASRAVAAITRTASVIQGDLHRTIRVGGTFGAERSFSLITPQFRGSRSGRGRIWAGAPSTDLPAATASTAASNDATTATSSLGATRGTTNRFSDMSGSTNKGSTVPDRATTSTNLTASQNLGSTAGNLIDPSGSGSSGMSDFMLVLMKCASAGSHVKAGDVVAEFDRQYQLLRLDDYKASLVQQEAGLQKMKADQSVARQSYDQSVKTAFGNWAKANVDLQTIPVRADIEAEEFKLTEQEMSAAYKEVRGELKFFQTSQQAALRISELDHDQAKIEFSRSRGNVDNMLMKTPMDGVVVMQTIYRGGDYGQVQQGDQLYPGQGFMTIVDTSSMVLNATVNQVDSEALRVGMKAKVHLDAYPDVTLDATLMAVGAMTNVGGWRANYVRDVPIRLKVTGRDPRVIPDLSGSADIEISSEPQTTVVPLESVFHDGSGKPYVLVASPAGFEKREVDLGLASNVAVAVRSGLRPGELVALARPLEEKR